MNHLPLPQGKGHIRIPNLTRSDYTSGEGRFHGFPTRQGWSIQQLEDIHSLAGRPGADVSIPEFFQNWLFFGCAIEVFSISGVVVSQSDLLDNERQHVDTRRLPSLIRQWRQRAQQTGGKNSATIIQWATKTALILKKVSDYVDLYCIPYSDSKRGRQILQHRHPNLPLPEKVWVSIIALGHTLTEAMLSIYGIVRTGSKWGSSSLLKQKMLNRGWCPMDVQRSLRDMGVDGHYYIAKSSNLEVNISHDRCTQSQCFARNIDEVTYQQKHCCESGKCNMVLVDEALLCKIIDAGQVPVCSWDQSKTRLSLKPSTIEKRGSSSLPFLAISHVWSDGLGNPHHNGLYQCQLDQLQAMVKAAATDHKLKGQPVHFWIDTLAVPVRDTPEMKERRMRCIRQMASIYKGAVGTLVLSANLRKIPSNAPEHERGLALYLTNWVRRLWTFQEGMLSEKILLQFADKVINMDHMIYPEVGRSITRGRCVTFPKKASVAATSSLFILRDILRDKMFEMMGAMYARVGPLAPAISALQFRSTSKLSDETICLGALMRLRIARLLEVDKDIIKEYSEKGVQLEKVSDHERAERRMETFLSMVRVFPHDIIFNSHTRLTRDGFRWAPSSFLGIPSGGFTATVEGSFTTFDKQQSGLSYTGSGFIATIPCGSKNGEPLDGDLLVRLPMPNTKILEVVVRRRKVGGELLGNTWPTGRKYAFILRRPLQAGESQSSNASKFLKTPTNGPELEVWFETLFAELNNDHHDIDVVVGTVVHGDEGYSSSKDVTTIRHEFLATLTVLNPSALPEHGLDESELLKRLGINDSGRSGHEEAQDSPSTDDEEEESTIDEEDLSTDDDDDSLDSSDSADFDLKEDFETSSDCSEDPDRYGDVGTGAGDETQRTDSANFLDDTLSEKECLSRRNVPMQKRA
ncbi:hypothetical protein B0A52_00333 [Exophiala mesophila]|uniref:Heterokaryon incompatibility domain-containing protein n=1 Tax=Exophiala mesophila TaxID=212818 RepID=A0A438NJR4_EXOME|nr:hypothetical protein B0A52_00333 [Exophiala mesophila]